MPTDAVSLYAASRDRIVGLTRNLPDEAARRPVLSCPRWTVHELLAHLAGVAQDFATGNMEGAPGEAWTEAQIGPRRDKPTAEVVEEWAAAAPEFDAALGNLPAGLATIAVADVVSHEHDLRQALERPGARDDEAVEVALQFMGRGLGRRINEAGLPPLRLRTEEGDELVAGTGKPAATVTAPRFELFRGIAGRRSKTQVAAYEWDGALEPYEKVWPTFGVYAERDIVE